MGRRGGVGPPEAGAAAEGKGAEAQGAGLHAAGKGLGTRTGPFVRIFGGASAGQLGAVAEAFARRFGTSLVDCLRGEFVFDLDVRKLLATRCRWARKAVASPRALPAPLADGLAATRGPVGADVAPRTGGRAAADGADELTVVRLQFGADASTSLDAQLDGGGDGTAAAEEDAGSDAAGRAAAGRGESAVPQGPPGLKKRRARRR